VGHYSAIIISSNSTLDSVLVWSLQQICNVIFYLYLASPNPNRFQLGLCEKIQIQMYRRVQELRAVETSFPFYSLTFFCIAQSSWNSFKISSSLPLSCLSYALRIIISSLNPRFLFLFCVVHSAKI
jgi:hypothetical protein